MLTTIADFIQALKEKEQELLSRYSIDHPVMIGSMFEGLTRSLLERVIPNGLNINICEGKIINDSGEETRQIDCMIVVGDGEKIPYTSFYKYHIDNVIAVIEVKKNLHFTDLVSSYENLKSVIDVSKGSSRKYRPGEARLFRDAYTQIRGNLLPSEEEIAKYSIEEYSLYYTLRLEAALPLRIVLGYWGYKTEKGLRDGFIKYLEEYMETQKLSPLYFPHQIIVDNYSLIKCNGMPYSTRIDKDNYWMVMASYNKTPMKILLELLFTRLTYIHEVSSEIFGDDLELEIVSLLLKGKAITIGDKSGWEYASHDMNEAQLIENRGVYNWEPTEIDQTSHFLLSLLCNDEKVDFYSSEFINYLKEKGLVIEEVISNVISTGFCCIKDGQLFLLRSNLLTFFYEGKCYAAENKSGRAMNWIDKKVKAKST